MPIFQDIIKNTTEAINYEIEGIKRRWDRRLQLLQKLKEIILGQGILAQVRIMETGRIHYDYEPIITNKAIHY